MRSGQSRNRYHAAGGTGSGRGSLPTADADAEPVAIDLHLLDSTCSGHCHADFTVVVSAPMESAQ
jgi:hypothetical protein